MNNKQLFEEFEDLIKNKYRHMSNSMLILSEDFPKFFFENNIEVNEFAKKDIKNLFDNYLDFMELSEAECSMLFQTLIDFCEFCKTKRVNIGYLEEYLIKNKEDIFEFWMETDEESIENNPFKDIAPEEFIQNFDIYYNTMNFEKSKKKLKETDLKKIIDFLEKTHKLMKVTFEKSIEIRKNNPELSDKEYLKKLDETINKEYGKELFSCIPKPDDMMAMVFSLPKKQAKKFFELAFKLEEASKFKFGTIKRKETIEGILNSLQELIENVKKTNNENQENELWEEGAFIETLGPEDVKEKMKTFHKKHDEDMNYQCKKCNKKISAHNKDWHDGMCDDCFNKEHH